MAAYNEGIQFFLRGHTYKFWRLEIKKGEGQDHERASGSVKSLHTEEKKEKNYRERSDIRTYFRARKRRIIPPIIKTTLPIQADASGVTCPLNPKD